MNLKIATAALVLCVVSLSAAAHVTVWPRSARAGGYEKYVVRVPTEGKVATASVELSVPEGVVIVSMGAPAGFRYELKKTADRVTSIVWTMRIEPGEFAEFAFIARNPAREGPLVWKAVQQFVDGTRTEWNGPTGDKRPASITTLLLPAGAEHSH